MTATSNSGRIQAGPFRSRRGGVPIWLLCNLCVGVFGAFLMVTLGDTVKPWLLYGKPGTNEWIDGGGDGLTFIWGWLIVGTTLTVLASALVSKRVARTHGLPQGAAISCGIVVSLAVPLMMTFDAAWFLRQ